MSKSPESVRSKKLPRLVLVLSLGASSLGSMGCGNFTTSNSDEASTPSVELPTDGGLIVITRQDCLEEYGNPNPFIGDAIVADPETGVFQQIEDIQVIDSGVVPLHMFENYALGLYDRFCGTPFPPSTKETVTSPPTQPSAL
ncbi:MAG TPA: hypothetical protein PJ984_04480 [Candidatus Saccharibacteria bacterium]|nr:hypothetical protein [Candidatus Saccharibacteria bacterium]